jgi:hypothetical protein
LAGLFIWLSGHSGFVNLTKSPQSAGWVDRLLVMADRDTGIRIEMLDACSASEGWAVVYRVAGISRRIVAVYLTRAHAEAAADQIRKQIDRKGEAPPPGSIRQGRMVLF